MIELLRQVIESSDDVFAVRQRGREVAAAVGFDEADQVRIATALSEVGRDVLGAARPATAVFGIDPAATSLAITVDEWPWPSLEPSLGAAAARRLMTEIKVEQRSDGSLQVVLLRRLPAPIAFDETELMRSKIAGHVLSTPLDELRSQNRQLLASLEDVEAGHRELASMNAELEETNRGVMAMYNQLSDELDTTNRGVVALYKELDDASRQLEAASDAKSRFLSSVSHELRGPANSMVGLSRLLLDADEAALAAPQRRQVELLASSADELLGLVNQLLDLAKAESGRLDVRLAVTDLAPMLAELVAASRALAREGVDVRLDAPATLTILTDEALVRQVVRNLLTNALGFTEVGHVAVSVVAADDAIEILVSDTGIGIAPEHAERVFDEFFQVRNPLQNARRGTGLGLPYAQRVVHTLGGELTLTTAVGEGSSFTVRLPADHTPPGSLLGDRVGTLLIVDDDASFRAVLAALVSPLATHVVEADGGAAAVDVLMREHVDVVLLDLVMADMSGVDVLAAIDAEPRLDDVRVVVVTSLEITEQLRHALRTAHAIVNKSGLTVERLESVMATARSAG